MVSGCGRCSLEVLHCHGTLVRHEDGAWECSAPGCAGDPIGHDFVLVCADVWVGCCGGAGGAGADERGADASAFRMAGAA